MNKSTRNRLVSIASIVLLSVGFSSVVRAADIYLLQVGLYAIICEDGQIFSYQGSEGGLDVVVPALCEGHGGVANPGDGAAPLRDSQARVRGGGTEVGGSLATGARASQTIRGRASAALAQSMERCAEQNEGRVNVRGAGNATILRCHGSSNVPSVQGQVSRGAAAQGRAAPRQAERQRVTFDHVTLERSLERNPQLRQQLSAALEANNTGQLNALLRQAGISGAANIGGPAYTVYCEPLGENTLLIECISIIVNCATC